jgi:hypothetical protein
MIRLRAAFWSRKLYWTVAADFNVIGACTSRWSSGKPPKKGPRFDYKRGPDFFGKAAKKILRGQIFAASRAAKRFRSIRFDLASALQSDPADRSNLFCFAYSRGSGVGDPLHPCACRRSLCRRASFLGTAGVIFEGRSKHKISYLHDPMQSAAMLAYHYGPDLEMADRLGPVPAADLGACECRR